jgi:DNA-binding NarL/FixJ family response regulator
MISVLIADDHPLFRKGLRQALGEDPCLTIVGEADDGAAALRMIEEVRPDVAVLDIDMPLLRGLQVARLVSERQLSVAVIILTIYKEEDMFHEAMDAGVQGYVMKETAVLDLLKAIRAVAAGRYYLSPAVAGHLVGRSRRARQLLGQKPGLAVLTPSERRVLNQIAMGRTSKEIADDLCISYRTVETHRTNIASKLGVRGSHSLLKFALEHRSSL